MEEHTKLVIEILAPLMVMIGWMWKNLSSELKRVDQDLKRVDQDLKNLDRRVQRIEDRLEFSNKIVYVQHEEPKEN